MFIEIARWTPLDPTSCAFHFCTELCYYFLPPGDLQIAPATLVNGEKNEVMPSDGCRNGNPLQAFMFVMIRIRGAAFLSTRTPSGLRRAISWPFVGTHSGTSPIPQETNQMVSLGVPTLTRWDGC